MKDSKQNLAHAVWIERDYWDVPVRVRLRPYVQFSCWLDGELQKLVARWAHTAAENPFLRRSRRRQESGRRKP